MVYGSEQTISLGQTTATFCTLSNRKMRNIRPNMASKGSIIRKLFQLESSTFVNDGIIPMRDFCVMSITSTFYSWVHHYQIVECLYLTSDVDKKAIFAIDDLLVFERRFTASLSPSKGMGTETRPSHGGGGVDQQYPEQGVTRFQQTSPVRGLVGTGEHSGSSSLSFINNTGEHNWRTKSDKVLPSLRPIDLSPGRYNEPRRSASRSYLKRITEELDSGDTMSEPDDFREGSSSAKPHYYGSTAFGFSEDDDDDEFLLDEELAKDGLYRGKRPLPRYIRHLTCISQATIQVCYGYTQLYR